MVVSGSLLEGFPEQLLGLVFVLGGVVCDPVQDLVGLESDLPAISVRL